MAGLGILIEGMKWIMVQRLDIPEKSVHVVPGVEGTYRELA